MSFQLTIAEGKEAGKEFVFDQNSVVIGRTSDCDVILYDPGVSRKHARIFVEGPGFFVEDMGSSNGTKVNGTLIKKQPLADGDAVSLGPVVFNFTSQVVPEELNTSPAKAIADLSTRIVAADDVKRQRNKGVALVPPDASEDQVRELARSSTMSMEAVRRSPGTAAAVARKATPEPSALDSPRPEPLRIGRPLSAAERARIRRESSGMQGMLRIFWLEANRSVRGAILLGLFLFVGGVSYATYVVALKPADTGPKHEEPDKLGRSPIEDSFGLGEGVTWSRPDMKVFKFDFLAPSKAVVLLHYQAMDISQGEVVITVNGVDLGQAPADTLNPKDRMNELIIPPTSLKKGEVNQVIFDNTKNPPGHETWRIWNVWVEIALIPEVAPEMLMQEADNAFKKAQQFYDRRDVGAENRYEAWRNYRQAWLMLETTDPKPELYMLAREKVKETQQELDRICSKLMLEEAGFYTQKNWVASRSTLDHVRQYFPNNDQACPYKAEQKRMEQGL